MNHVQQEIGLVIYGLSYDEIVEMVDALRLTRGRKKLIVENHGNKFDPTIMFLDEYYLETTEVGQQNGDDCGVELPIVAFDEFPYFLGPVKDLVRDVAKEEKEPAAAKKVRAWFADHFPKAKLVWEVFQVSR